MWGLLRSWKGAVFNGFFLPYVLWLFKRAFDDKTWCFLFCPLVFKDSGYTLDNMPEWRNGRRTRLKIWHPFGYTGSTPVSGIRGLLPTVGILPPLARFMWYYFGFRGLTPTVGILPPLRGSYGIIFGFRGLHPRLDSFHRYAVH